MDSRTFAFTLNDADALLIIQRSRAAGLSPEAFLRNLALKELDNLPEPKANAPSLSGLKLKILRIFYEKAKTNPTATWMTMVELHDRGIERSGTVETVIGNLRREGLLVSIGTVRVAPGVSPRRGPHHTMIAISKTGVEALLAAELVQARSISQMWTP